MATSDVEIPNNLIVGLVAYFAVTFLFIIGILVSTTITAHFTRIQFNLQNKNEKKEKK